MGLQFVYKLLLKRRFFRGQDRLFNFLFTRKKLNQKSIIVKPIEGSFKIKCDTATWIGAKIVYTGDYEPALKRVFKTIIKPGDYILDVGANIGFHSLYFADLVGKTGSVISFEPVPYNFQSLQYNISINNFSNITVKNIALSNKNEQLFIVADENSLNPGTFNLFDTKGNIKIDCCIGDEVIGTQKIDLIKIDVEGYESFVIEGLLETIKKNRPKIIFEYDKYYHLKTKLAEDHIFSLLSKLNYHFLHIYQSGPVVLNNFKDLKSGNILAIPND